MTSEPQPSGETVSAPSDTTVNESERLQTVPARQYREMRKQKEYWERRAKKSEAERNVGLAIRHAGFTERNRIVATLARIFPGSHLVEGTADQYADRKGRQIIRDLCCVHLPDGSNLTWHFSPEEAKYFSGIRYASSDYDGHTTSLKYDRLEEISLGTVLEAAALHFSTF